jgi:hypothetical protein
LRSSSLTSLSANSPNSPDHQIRITITRSPNH